jgi:Tfp pilus assembly protein PilV
MRPSRSGFTLIESCTAAALLAATLTVVVALLTSVARQRQGASRHAQAVVVVDNLLERLTAEPFDAITPQRADELRQSLDVAETLPNGEVTVHISDAAGSPPGKRIEVDVSWRTGNSGPSPRHAVATWVYRREGKR